MILWTIQEKKFFDDSIEKGVILCEWSHVSSDYVASYEWICDQMLRKKIISKKVPPVWAWYKYNGIYRKPDLRYSRHLPRGTDSVCIEFDAEDGNVLLSQFEMWNWVLRGEYLPQNGKEYEVVEKMNDNKLLTIKKIQQSWKNMFDLTFGDEEFWGRIDNRWVQACVPQIYVNQIRKVIDFVAR